EKILPIRRKALHAIVGGADPNAVPAIDGDANRSGEVLRAAAEPARLGAIAAERQERFALGRELLHAPEFALCRADIPLPVEGEEVRAAGAVLRPVDAVKLARLGAVLAPLAQEFPLRREALHPAIDLVRDVDAAVLADGDTTRLIEFAIALAVLAPFAQEFASLVVNDDLVAHHGRDVNGAGFVHGDAAGRFVDGEVRQRLALGGELLHAIVVELRDVDFVFGVD